MVALSRSLLVVAFVLALGGAMPGLVFAVDRVAAAPAAAGAALLLGATVLAFGAYVATGVGNAVAWRAERPDLAHPALGLAAVAAGVLAAALLSLALA